MGIKERLEMAKRGEGLDELIKDDDWEVRKAVAEQGFGLGKLIEDENELVRAAVAEQGYGLARLVDDSSPDVRLQVARKSYGLDKLVQDSDYLVRRMASIEMKLEIDRVKKALPKLQEAIENFEDVCDSLFEEFKAVETKTVFFHLPNKVSKIISESIVELQEFMLSKTFIEAQHVRDIPTIEEFILNDKKQLNFKYKKDVKNFLKRRCFLMDKVEDSEFKGDTWLFVVPVTVGDGTDIEESELLYVNCVLDAKKERVDISRLRIEKVNKAQL